MFYISKNLVKYSFIVSHEWMYDCSYFFKSPQQPEIGDDILYT